MKEQRLIPNEELISFLKQHNCVYKNRQDVNIILRLPSRIILSSEMEVANKEKYSLRVQTEFKFMKLFLAEYRIYSIADLHNINRAELLIRYLKSKGEVIGCNKENNTEVTFTVTKNGKTYMSTGGEIIKIDKVLSLPEEFEGYMRRRLELIT